jgi:hypothetical protein
VLLGDSSSVMELESRSPARDFALPGSMDGNAPSMDGNAPSMDGNAPTITT